MITENASILKIHQLSKEQYERELAAGNIQKNELYLVPDESKVFVFTVTGEYGTSHYCDKTFSEIKEAYDKNYLIVGIYQNICHIVTDINSNEIKFYTNYVKENGVYHCFITISSSDMVNFGAVNFDNEFSYGNIIHKLTSETFNTTNKTISGAINELNAKHTEGTDALILLSPNGTRFSITVGDDGVLSATEIETTTE